MLKSLLFNTIEIYYVALAISLVFLAVLAWLRRPWMFVAIHLVLTLWVLFAEANAVVDDRDAIFMMGVGFRIAFCNLIVFVVGQVFWFWVRPKETMRPRGAGVVLDEEKG